LHINNIGYNHTHDADFEIQRPCGSGDYLLLLLKTPAIFTLGGKDIITEPDSFILFRYTVLMEYPFQMTGFISALPMMK